MKASQFSKSPAQPIPHSNLEGFRFTTRAYPGELKTGEFVQTWIGRAIKDPHNVVMRHRVEGPKDWKRENSFDLVDRTAVALWAGEHQVTSIAKLFIENGIPLNGERLLKRLSTAGAQIKPLRRAIEDAARSVINSDLERFINELRTPVDKNIEGVWQKALPASFNPEWPKQVFLSLTDGHSLGAARDTSGIPHDRFLIVRDVIVDDYKVEMKRRGAAIVEHIAKSWYSDWFNSESAILQLRLIERVPGGEIARRLSSESGTPSTPQGIQIRLKQILRTVPALQPLVLSYDFYLNEK